MLIVSVAGALRAASGYVSAFTDAANTIYEVDEGRPFWKLKPIQLLITLVLILMAASVALALVLSGPIVGALGGALGLSDTALSCMADREVAGDARARARDLRRPLLRDARTRA